MSSVQATFQNSYTAQITALQGWLGQCLAEAGITGAPAKRANNRLTEFVEEIDEIVSLIGAATADTNNLTKLSTYEKFDAIELFPAELAKRADGGIQDLGSGIWDELADIARTRKKELEGKIAKDKPLDANTLELWQLMSACDCVEEIGATVLRMAEAVRYLFQAEFLRVARLAKLAADASPKSGESASTAVSPGPIGSNSDGSAGSTGK